MSRNEPMLDMFIHETNQMLDKLEEILIECEEKNSLNDKEVIGEIFRIAHTIKGSSGMMMFNNISGLTHILEDYFDLLRENPNAEVNSKEIVDLNFQVIDYIKKEIALIEQDKLSDDDASELKEKIKEEELKLKKELGIKERESELKEESRKHIYISKAKKESTLSKFNRYKVRVFFDENAEMENIRAFGVINSLKDCTDEIIHYPEDVIDDVAIDIIKENGLIMYIISEIDEKELKETIESTVFIKSVEIKEIKDDDEFNYHLENKKKFILDDTIKIPEVKSKDKSIAVDLSKDKKQKLISIHTEKLDSIMDLVGELVVSSSLLNESMYKNKNDLGDSFKVLNNHNKIINNLQDSFMQLRMLPIKATFNKMKRIVRDASNNLNKKVHLEIKGEETEVDKNVIEQISDPLMHIIRNAVDHGIELPDDRIEKNKSEEGKILLEAYHEGGYVNINIIDNGKGIDANKIKEKAIKNKIITEDEADKFSEKEILMLIFEPGFSMAEKVTDLSGRGVGMNVVKTNVEKLGGIVELDTELGSGSKFRLMLPLTLAIVPSLIIGESNFKFAISQANIQEIVRIKESKDNKQIEYVNGAEVLRIRENLLPLIRLREVLNLEDKENINDTYKILVIRIGSKKYGLIVGEIFDEEKILVKPLPNYFANCIFYSGVTIMGDGKTAMILDPEGIMKRQELKFSDEESKIDSDIRVKEDENLNSILLFKSSGSEIFGVDLSSVGRIEEIQKDDIEEIGDKKYIQYRGDSLRIIELENYLDISKKEINKDKLYLIIPKNDKYNAGILIESVFDSLNIMYELNDKELKQKGIKGSAIINNKITLIFDMNEFFTEYDITSSERVENRLK